MLLETGEEAVEEELWDDDASAVAGSRSDGFERAY